MEPTSHRSYGPAEGSGYFNAANERLRILGEIALRKTDASGRPVRDVNGDPDTSFLARIPADTPFTFQTLDKDGLALNTSQTWHQLRPGEVRNDCGGCHAHSQVPTAFEKTAAARPEYAVPISHERRPCSQKARRVNQRSPCARTGRRTSNTTGISSRYCGARACSAIRSVAGRKRNSRSTTKQSWTGTRTSTIGWRGISRPSTGLVR